MTGRGAAEESSGVYPSPAQWLISILQYNYFQNKTICIFQYYQRDWLWSKSIATLPVGGILTTSQPITRECGDHSKEWTAWCKPTAKRITVYGHQESLRSQRYVLKRQSHQSLTIFVSSASLYLIVYLRVLLDTRIFIIPAWSPKNQT